MVNEQPRLEMWCYPSAGVQSAYSVAFVKMMNSKEKKENVNSF